MTSLKRIMVIRKLLLKRCVKTRTASIKEIAAWFPSEHTRDIEELIEEMLADDGVPIKRYGVNQEIRLVGVKSAIEYIDAQGGEVPSNLEKHLD